MSRVAIIPARGGSRRIPRKNIRPFFGKPIIAYSIEAAHESGLFEHGGVWVSTDSPEVAEIARYYGAGVHQRRPALAENDVGTQEVMAAALLDLQADTPERIDVACCIYATAPLMSVGDLRRGLGMLRACIGPYAYSVDASGRDVGQFYWGERDAFVTGVPLEDARTQKVVIAAKRCCDINTEDDWRRAQDLYARLHRLEVTP